MAITRETPRAMSKVTGRIKEKKVESELVAEQIVGGNLGVV